MPAAEGASKRDRLLGWALIVYGTGLLVAWCSDVFAFVWMVARDGMDLRGYSAATFWTLEVLGAVAGLAIACGFMYLGKGLRSRTRWRDTRIVRGAAVVMAANLVLACVYGYSVLSSWSSLVTVVTKSALALNVGSILLQSASALFVVQAFRSRSLWWQTGALNPRYRLIARAAACYAVSVVVEGIGRHLTVSRWLGLNQQLTLEYLGAAVAVVAAVYVMVAFTRKGSSPRSNEEWMRGRDRLLLGAAGWLVLSALIRAVADRGLVSTPNWREALVVASTLGEFLPSLTFVAAALLAMVGLSRRGAPGVMSSRPDDDESGCIDLADRI